ncbi:hypothetical protein ACFU7T_19020 [Streptomyces sp. NPDC057555]|uniref:deoxynucleotide monophosphate kinase family protein n=1 Tax=Streptomyces sp. NPDC057555 TaxID=3346166 RepID=UPI0036747014
MSFQHIALMGKARSGKDTIAERLVHRWSFTRVAFADPLKGAALRINPLIPTACNVLVRLNALVRDVGWEYAKDHYPEVRRTLQHAGQAVRDLDPDFWVHLAMDKVGAADSWSMPVVVTDCRHPNEVEALRNRGFVLVRVVRPGAATATSHESETALDAFPEDVRIVNDGTVLDLSAEADALVRRR